MSTHFISLTDAAALTKKFRDERNNILAESYKNTDTLLTCETFDRAAIDAILSQNGCTGFRVYLGMDDNFLVKLIAVGVDSDGNDMLPQNSTTTGSTSDDILVENGNRCPPLCPTSSPLNS